MDDGEDNLKECIAKQRIQQASQAKEGWSLRCHTVVEDCNGPYRLLICDALFRESVHEIRKLINDYAS